MKSTALYPIRVTTGLELLTVLYPDCIDRFNLETLNVHNCYSCPLAQASGMTYFEAIESQEPALREVLYYMGYVFGFVREDPYEDIDLHILTAEWKKQIAKRRSMK